MRKFAFAFAAIVAAAGALADFVQPVDLATGTPGANLSLFDMIETQGFNPTGDTYTAAPLVQDGISAFYISAGQPGTHSFDGASSLIGANQANAGGSLRIIEAYIPTGVNTARVAVEITALNAAGARQRWVAAGVAGPNGAFTSWRMDVGSNAGGANKITPNVAWTVTGAGFSAFNEAGTNLGNFAMSLNSSDATGLSGLAVLGLGGANIAGFNMASMQMFWDIEVVPEPASLMLVGLGALAAIRRR